ncbi:aldo/keto reductase [Candidatus Uabimicrobium sp. HlEnr_7]|uniref:aldo/keto reductase n=1 Tax=Candidatus Uabimicrobium helgolandensis TaxID=3095367 RepID=UPI0035590530
MNIKTTTLNNGQIIPYLGLGVYQSPPGEVTQNAIVHALQNGYRHIDTAKLYDNEKDVGIAVAKSSVPRDEIFITTKLWNDDHGYDSALEACKKSIDSLGTYIDLYLIHFPVENIRKESWRALEQLYKDGLCKSIGVSNYTVRHLKELLSVSGVVPAVNQVEFSPYLYQKELLDFCRENNIQLQAYSPLTRGQKLDDAKLMTIAEKYKKTTAQILIKWCLQHEIVVLPKSINHERIVQNSQIFDFSITSEDMDVLDNFNENFRTCWNPTDTP